VTRPTSWKLRQPCHSWFAKLVLALTLALPAVPSVFAGPLPEHWVAKGIDWVIHVDAERLSEAEALNPLFDAMTASSWGASLADMGIDARMDVSGITMFGTMTRAPDARGETTTMLQGGEALREAIQKHVEAHDGYTLVLRSTLRANGSRISAWTIDSLSVHVALVPMQETGTIPGEPSKLVAVLSDNSDRLQASIGLLLADDADHRPQPPDGGGSHLGGEVGPACPRPGCVMFAWAKDLDKSHRKLRSELLASAKRLVAHVGYREEDGQIVVFANLEVHGNEEANGDQMMSALNNMIEFWASRTITLSRTNPEYLEMLPLVDACQVSREGSNIKLAMEKAITQAAAPPLESVERGPGTTARPNKSTSIDR